MRQRNYRPNYEHLADHIIRDCQGAQRIWIDIGNYVTIRIIHHNDVITYTIDEKLYKIFKRRKK